MKLLLPSRAGTWLCLHLLGQRSFQLPAQHHFSPPAEMCKQGNCQITGACVFDLEKSLFLPLFGNLCIIPAGEELVYDPWQKRG